jgi:hypothetical protein
MKKIILIYILIFTLYAGAECPLDHLIVGCNQDGIEGTADDNTLFVDSAQKYRSSGSTDFEKWYYPLSSSFFTDYKWRLGEPGFEMFQDDNPNALYTYDQSRALSGEPNSNYQIIIECVDISPGLRVVHKDTPAFTIDQPGQTFDYSYIHKIRSNSHIHLSFQAVDNTTLKWVTWRLCDTLGQYLPSEPFSIVFNKEPAAGDLYIDGIVDLLDLHRLAFYLLENQGGVQNDFYERADTNRDGNVDIIDFAALASNWLID